MFAEPVLAALGHVWKTLAGPDIPVAVIGGMAVARWQHLRVTKDVDLLIGIESAQVDALLAKLRAAGIQPINEPPVLKLDQYRFIPLVYEPPDVFLNIHIDLMIADSAFQQLALARSTPLRLPQLDFEMRVISCEDLIVFKLIAGRIIDRADVAALLRLNRETLDLSYLSKWIGDLGLQSDFAAVWDEAFPGESPPSSS